MAIFGTKCLTYLKIQGNDNGRLTSSDIHQGRKNTLWKSNKRLSQLEQAMASSSATQSLVRAIGESRPLIRKASPVWLASRPKRALHHSRTPVITSSTARLRPKLQPSYDRTASPLPVAVRGRTIFIQTENTPNADVSR